MPTSNRDAAWLRRFLTLILAGLALMLAGRLIQPTRHAPRSN
jgi:hypothetical protein